MITIRLFGAIDLRGGDGQELRGVLAQPKRLALLAYLAAAEPAGPHRRDTLLGLFWPELDQDRARNNLSQAVHFLRRWLGDAAITSRGGEDLALAEPLVWVDVRAFHAALAATAPPRRSSCTAAICCHRSSPLARPASRSGSSGSAGDCAATPRRRRGSRPSATSTRASSRRRPDSRIVRWSWRTSTSGTCAG